MSEGDLRFAATLLNHAVFADEHDSAARNLLAEVYTALGRGTENGTWRNVYLMGALELNGGIVPAGIGVTSPDMIAALTVEQIFDSLAIRVNGPQAWNEHFAIDWHLVDSGEHYRTTMSNGALIQQPNPPAATVDLTVRLTKPQLFGLLAGKGADMLDHDGDINVLRRLAAVLDDPAPDFAIVTP
ncbi:alkyl sulfatase C-terminal domain-containing protein [Acrocarpospora sp. B8E8]|uniref:alkyl sulfatase C-terminal domain-containing protein n=1 Tax=Acrocarpospora sp. B8E8 TaxID=3153572 RepID=UPI00325C9B6F